MSNNGLNLVSMLLEAGASSEEELRNRISSVRHAPVDVAIERRCECIYFEFGNSTYIGELRGRNRDLCIDPVDTDSEVNRAIAARTLVDQCATRLVENAQLC